MLTRHVRRALTALFLFGALSGSALAAPGDVGTPAANFNLQAFGGGSHQLSAYQGQVVVLFIIGYG